MNVENIYQTLNEILIDETDYETLRQRLVSLTSNIRVSLSVNNKKNVLEESNKSIRNVTSKSTCPTCGSTISTTTNVVSSVANKKALLIGINYRGTSNELNGCINDVNDMSLLLQSRYEFNKNNIEIVTDDTPKKPTKQNIITSLTSLLSGSKAGDTLVFMYSGHGINSRDRNRDEWDGMDELICPLDMNLISDDEMSNIIRTYLKKDVNLFTFFDCCNSGTILDLRYQYLDTMRTRQTMTNTNYSELNGNLVCISGCQDNQTSADSFINGRFNGALTWSFIQCTKDITRPNWLDLLSNMRNLLRQNRYSQIAQMSSGKLLANTSKLFL